MGRPVSKASGKKGVKAKRSSIPVKKGGVKKNKKKVFKKKFPGKKSPRTGVSSSSSSGVSEKAAAGDDARRGGERKRKSSPPPDETEGGSEAKKQKTVPAVQTKKERRAHRRSQRKDFELISDSLKTWERLRRHDLTNEERSQLLDELMTSITGHMYELAVKHDTARVVQWCLKLGSRQQRSAVLEELREHIVELSKLKYAKFTVKSLFKYCTPSERAALISTLHGHVCKLLRHTEAAEIVELAYNEWSNASQRSHLVQEFYGPLFTVFKDDQLASSPCGLDQLLAKEPEKREKVLEHMKQMILPLVNKSVVRHSIIHRVLLDYFLNCGESLRSEMIEALRESVLNILHTKEGSKVTLQCLWHGTAKDRKAIIKSFKGVVVKICKEEHGHVVMMGVFDCVDDTVLVKKALISEMVSHLGKLCDNQFGRRVLLYLLAPRSPRHFSPQFLTLLTPGDGNQHTKKSSDVRRRELLVGVSDPLVELASRKVCVWVRSKHHAPLLVEIAESATGDLSPLYQPMLVELSANLDPSMETHLATHPCGHWVVKRLLAIREGRRDTHDEESFAELLMKRVSTNQIHSWVKTNRGSFVVCGLLQCPSVRERVAAILSEGEVLGERDEVKGQQAIWNELHKSTDT